MEPPILISEVGLSCKNEFDYCTQLFYTFDANIKWSFDSHIFERSLLIIISEDRLLRVGMMNAANSTTSVL